MQVVLHIGSLDKRNSQVRLHSTGRFLQNRACSGKQESWHGMSWGSPWRLHSLLAATHCLPFMHFRKFLSRLTFCVWNRSRIATELAKHYLQILKLSNMRETQICELYKMLKLDLKISLCRHRKKKVLCLLFFESMLPNSFGNLCSKQVIFGVQGTVPSLFINSDADQRKYTKKCKNIERKSR